MLSFTELFLDKNSILDKYIKYITILPYIEPIVTVKTLIIGINDHPNGKR